MGFSQEKKCIFRKTFWKILPDHPDDFVWTQKNAKSPGASEYAEWVNQRGGDRGRCRGRSSSGRRSRSRRGRDAPSPPRRVREVPPPRTPPRAPPPRAARVEPYGEDRRLQLERELYALLHEDNGTPYSGLLEH